MSIPHYYIVYEKDKYPNVLKGIPEEGVTEKFKAGPFLKRFFLASALFLGLYSAYLWFRPGFAAINLIYYCSIIWVYLLPTVFFHENLHRRFIILCCSKKGYKCNCVIINRKGGGGSCIETEGYEFTRNEYISGLLTPLLITIFFGIIIITLRVESPDALMYLILAVIFFQGSMSSTDIRSSIMLFKMYDSNVFVRMVYEPFGSKDKDVPTGFVVFNKFKIQDQ